MLFMFNRSLPCWKERKAKDLEGQCHRVASNRVLRGGNYNNTARNCRSANRNNNNPYNANNNYGGRLALSHFESQNEPTLIPFKGNFDETKNLTAC